MNLITLLSAESKAFWAGQYWRALLSYSKILPNQPTFSVVSVAEERETNLFITFDTADGMRAKQVHSVTCNLAKLKLPSCRYEEHKLVWLSINSHLGPIMSFLWASYLSMRNFGSLRYITWMITCNIYPGTEESTFAPFPSHSSKYTFFS